MTVANPLAQISDRIKESAPGALFVASDFSDITDNDSIRKSLSRLTVRIDPQDYPRCVRVP